MSDDARAVMESHHQAVNGGSLEGVMANMADDVIAAVPGTPLIRGKDDFRAFYNGVLRMGQWTHAYDIQDVTAVGESVVMAGTSRGTLTPPAPGRTPSCSRSGTGRTGRCGSGGSRWRRSSRSASSRAPTRSGLGGPTRLTSSPGS